MEVPFFIDCPTQAYQGFTLKIFLTNRFVYSWNNNTAKNRLGKRKNIGTISNNLRA